jgi:plasmid stabilization system protein ParE
MTVRLLSPAQRELEQAILYLESQQPGLGLEFAEEFDRAVAVIEANPRTWPQASKNTHRYRMNRFEYGIIYAVHGDEAVVVAISHPSRQPDYWVDRI